jgi:integrase/recombinase XerD
VKAFVRSQKGKPPRPAVAPVIALSDLQEFVIHLRERGVKPVSCNCWMRALNAFCRWLHQQAIIPTALRLPPQRVEKRLLPVLDEKALRQVLRFCPKTFVPWRVYAVASTIPDTGCRIDELLTARVKDFDLDNLLLTARWGRGASNAGCRSRWNCGRCCSDSRR